MARFTNQARLTYSNGSADSNVAVGEILEVLSGTKTAVTGSYERNDSITYIISLVNSGSTALTGLTISDNLGSYTYNTQTLVPLDYITGSIKYYINGTLQTTPALTSTNPLTIAGISIPANGNTTIVYETQTNNYAPLSLEESITNQVVVTGNGITPITIEETVNANASPQLNITKSISPVPVTENGILTYTFLIENTGSTAADTTYSVIVTDTFNPILTDISVTFNGTAWTAGNEYTYDETTGLFSTTASSITVPAASYTRNPITGEINVLPGSSTLVVSGTV